MDNTHNIYIYNPVKQNKDIGRRTGKPIYKKRNVRNGVDNFDDYFSDTDDEVSINVTKHLQLSTTEMSHRHEGTASSAEMSEVAVPRKPHVQEDVVAGSNHHLFPEEFGNVRIVNPLALGSRFGRRTGKDILAGKTTKILATGMGNFSDYLSDSSEVSVSVQATPSPCSEGELSPSSTSAKESDGNLSPKKFKDRLSVHSTAYTQVPHKSVHTENSSTLCAPVNEVHIGVSSRERTESPANSISISSKQQNVQNRISIHESSLIGKNWSAEIPFPNECEQNTSASNAQHVRYLQDKAASEHTRRDGLPVHCTAGDPTFVDRAKITSLETGNNRSRLNTSEFKKQQDDGQARVYLSTHDAVQSYPEKENLKPGSSLQTENPSVTEGIQDRARNCNDGKFSADKAKVNQRTTQEASLDSKSGQQRCTPVKVCQPIASDQVDVLSGGNKTKASRSLLIQHADTEVHKNKNVSCSPSGRPQRVLESQTKNSTQKASVAIMSVHISSTMEGIHAVQQPSLSSGSHQTTNGTGQSVTPGNLTKTTTVEAALNFGGDITGSVSNSEKAISGQFFGIKKRLSYSAALIEGKQQNEEHKKGVQTKTLNKETKHVTKSVGSFLDQHNQVSTSLPDTASGTGTFITLAPRRVSRQTTYEKQVEPLSSLNTSTDSSDNLRNVNEEITVPKISRVGGGSKEIQVMNKAGKRQIRQLEEDETSPTKQTKVDKGKGQIDSDADIHHSIKELSVRQDYTAQDFHEGSKKTTKQLAKGTKRITKSVGSFLDRHDKVNTDYLDTMPGISTLITLAPRRVSQLINDGRHEKPLSSLNASMDSLDDFHIVEEEEVIEPKSTKSGKRGKKIQEFDKTGKRRITHSVKDETSPAKQRKAGKGVGKGDRNVKNTLVGRKSVNVNEITCLRRQQTKEVQAIKKGKQTASGKLDENKVVQSHKNTKEPITLQENSLHKVHKGNKKKFKDNKKKGKVKSNILAEQSKDENNVVQPAKQLKGNLKVPDLRSSHQLTRSLVLDSEHLSNASIDATVVLHAQDVTSTSQLAKRCTDTVVEDDSSVQVKVRSKQIVVTKATGEDKKLTMKVKKASADKKKNQKGTRRNKIARTRQNRIQVKTSKMSTRASSIQAEDKQMKLQNNSGVDIPFLNITEHEDDKSGMNSNNTGDGHAKTTNRSMKQSDLNVEKNVYLDIRKEKNSVKNVTKKIQGKICTENHLDTDSQEYDLNQHNRHASPQKELLTSSSRQEALDFLVPVKLSSGKNKKATRRAASNKKRQSCRTSTAKRKSALDRSDMDDESTPVKLQLMCSLPNITPQSGVSFRRSWCLTSTSADSVHHRPAATDLPSQTLRDPEFSTPCQKQRKVPPDVLTSCLKSSESVRPRRKGRRVRISSLIDQIEVFPAENHTSDSAPDATATTLLSPNASPVHYGETTTSHVYCKPKITVPDLSYKIIRPNRNAQPGLRRSARTRVMRLNTDRGEGIIYRRDSTGFGLLVDSIQPSVGEAKVKAVEEERRRKLRLRKLKAMCVPAKPSRRRLSTHLKVEDDVTTSTEIPVVNPDNNEQVLLELIAHRDAATWYGPDLDSVTSTDPLALCLHLKQPHFTTGEMHLRPLAEKPCELLEHTVIFSVISGKIHLRINDVSTIVETGDDFFIPRGSSYALKNLRREIAKLHFTDMDDTHIN